MADNPLHIIPADLLEAQAQLEEQGRRPQLRTSSTGGWQYFHTQLPTVQQQVGGSGLLSHSGVGQAYLC
jgi:hypothetical protein